MTSSPLRRFNKKTVSVTQIASQFWCEKQVELGLLFGRVKTKEMVEGRQQHKALEEEVIKFPEYRAYGWVDALAIKFNKTVECCRVLREGSKTRELPLYGKINNVFLAGVLDELEVKGDAVRLVDHKTRKANSLPNQAQRQTAEVQVMLYKRMLDDLKAGRFGWNELRGLYSLEEDKQTTPQLKEQALESEKALPGFELDVVKAGEKAFEALRSLPRTSHELEVVYELQKDGSVIGSHSFAFDEARIERDVYRALDYWVGNRSAEKTGDKWKCAFCEFKGRQCPVEEQRTLNL